MTHYILHESTWVLCEHDDLMLQNHTIRSVLIYQILYS